jgi:hypothetical protein
VVTTRRENGPVLLDYGSVTSPSPRGNLVNASPEQSPDPGAQRLSIMVDHVACALAVD